MKIQYRYHPLYGTEVQIVRTLRRYLEQIEIVGLPDGTERAVPAWMLDPVICHQLPQQDRPRISLSALLELAAWLDNRSLSGTAVRAVSAQDECTPRKDGDLSSTQTAAAEKEGLVGEIAAGQSDTVPGDIGSTVAPSRVRRHRRKEQP